MYSFNLFQFVFPSKNLFLPFMCYTHRDTNRQIYKMISLHTKIINYFIKFLGKKIKESILQALHKMDMFPNNNNNNKENSKVRVKLKGLMPQQLIYLISCLKIFASLLKCRN